MKDILTLIVLFCGVPIKSQDCGGISYIYNGHQENFIDVDKIQDDVRCIFYYDSSFASIPSFIFSNFTDLYRIKFDLGEINIVEQDAFSGFQQLTVMLDGTGTGVMRSGSFSNISNLTFQYENAVLSDLELNLYDDVESVELILKDMVIGSPIPPYFFSSVITTLTVTGCVFTTFDCWAFNHTGFPIDILWNDNEVNCNCLMQYAVTPLDDIQQDNSTLLYPVPEDVLEESLCREPLVGKKLIDFTDDPSSLPCDNLVAVEKCASPDDITFCPFEKTETVFGGDIIPEFDDEVECLFFKSVILSSGITKDTFKDYKNLKNVVFDVGCIIPSISAESFSDLKYLKIEFYSTIIIEIQSYAFLSIHRLQFISRYSLFQHLEHSIFANIDETNAMNFHGDTFETPWPDGFIPFNTTTMEVSETTLQTIECDSFHSFEPHNIIWNNNNIICDCRMNFLVHEDSVASGVVPFEVLNGTICSGPTGAEGRTLIEYVDDDLPCDNHIPVNDCEDQDDEDVYHCEESETHVCDLCDKVPQDAPVDTRCMIFSYVNFFIYGVRKQDFARYTKLVRVTFMNGLIISIRTGAFTGIPGDISIEFTAVNIVEIKKGAFKDIGRLSLYAFQSTFSTIEEDVFDNVYIVRSFKFEVSTFSKPIAKGFFPKNVKSLTVFDSKFDSISCGAFYYREPTNIVWYNTNVSCDCTMEYGLTQKNGALPSVILDSFCDSPPEHKKENHRLKDFDSPGMTLPCLEGDKRVSDCNPPGSGGRRNYINILYTTLIGILIILKYN